MKQQRSNYCHAVNKLPGNLFRTRKYVICDSQNLTEMKFKFCLYFYETLFLTLYEN